MRPGRPLGITRRATVPALAATVALAWVLAQAVLLALVLVGVPAVQAAPAIDTRPDAALEARVQALAAELRCLVCQNQSLADSNADLAVDLKNRVREQLRAGRSEAEVMAFMTERYGDFVRYRPPFKATTLLLWAGPALMVLIGAALLWRALRRAGVHGAEGPADRDGHNAERLQQAAALLGGPAQSQAGGHSAGPKAGAA